MKMLSPADALGPAFRRTREVMATPFRLGFFLKITLVAALTQPSFYSVTISYPLQGIQLAAGTAMRRPSHLNFAAASSGAGTVAVFGVFAVMLLIGLFFWVAITYLFCRLRFTLFDLVIYRQGSVRNAWLKYGRQTWRYFGIILLASLSFLVLLAVTIGPFAIRMFKAIMQASTQGRELNPFSVLSQILPVIGIGLLMGLGWAIVDAILQDFVLPQIAIEDSSIEAAFGRFFKLLRTDTSSVLVYLLLRFVVAIGLSWALMMAVFIVLLVLGLGGVAVGAGLYHAMWHGGTGMQVVFGMIVGVLALFLLALYLLALISVYGTTAVFKQSYAAYFFGSRYTALGNRLEPPEEEMVAVAVEPPLPPLPPLQEPPPIW